MKHIRLRLLYILGLALFGLSMNELYAQVEYDPETDEARMHQVIEVKGIDQETLYDRARVWMSQNLKSTDENILLNDETKSTLVATNNLRLPNQSFGIFIHKDRVLNHKITIECKDGRYRCSISNIVYSYWSTGGNVSDKWYTTELNETYKHLFEKDQKRLEKGKQTKEKHKELVEYDDAFIALANSLQRAMIGSNKESSDW